MLYLDTRLSGTLYSNNTQYCILNTPVLFYEIIPGLLKGSLATRRGIYLCKLLHTEHYYVSSKARISYRLPASNQSASVKNVGYRRRSPVIGYHHVIFIISYLFLATGMLHTFFLCFLRYEESKQKKKKKKRKVCA
jgi:hypothetical protein